MLSPRLLVGGLMVLLQACAVEDSADPVGGSSADAIRTQSAGEGDCRPKSQAAPASSGSTVGPCGTDSAAVFFHGLGGAGRDVMSTPHVCVPSIGNDEFATTDTTPGYAPEAEKMHVVAGFSAGRIPLIRRLEQDTRLHGTSLTYAVLLDPSWADGSIYRKYTADCSRYLRTGPEIVAEWLATDVSRHFILAYLSDAGSSEYSALAESKTKDTAGLPIAARVCVVKVAASDHLGVPRALGNSILTDPAGWARRYCGVDGGAGSPDRTGAGR